MKVGQSGQALVLVLLSLSVVLTIVLFVVARSVTDVAVSSGSENSIRAFSAAEAGVEKALVGLGTTSPTTASIGDASYTASINPLAGAGTSYNYPAALSSGDSMTVWFVSHDTDGNLYAGACSATYPCFSGTQMTVCWGKPGTAASSAIAPAIEISVFYEATPIRIGRVTADPYRTRPGSNNFADIDHVTSCTISGVTYAFQKTINFGPDIGATNSNTAGNLQFARVRMFYNSNAQPVGISVAGSSLPSQGLSISSTGTAGSSNRKVLVFQSWPEVPSVFDYAVYNGTGGLTK